MSQVQNERLKMYLEAEKAVLTGQSYTIGNRTLTRASLSAIQAEINRLVAGGATLAGDIPDQAGHARRVVLMD